MTVLLLHDHRIAGGAARAAWRCGWALHRAGNRVVHVTGDYRGTNFRETKCLNGKPARGWRRLGMGLGDSASRRREKVRSGWAQILEEVRPDVIWVHNIAGGFKWGWGPELATAARQKAPVVWTLHDMRALGDGPDYFSPDELGQRSGESWLRQEAGRPAPHPLTVTAPSRWLAGLASQIISAPAAYLPNPLPLEIFRVRERAEARRALGWPESPDHRVVFALAENLRDPRKGMDLLRTAWQRLSPGRNATLCLAGRGGDAWEGVSGVRWLGSAESPTHLSYLYAAADLLALPSRLENAPCVIQEAMACGTPVLAVDAGGMGEMIRHGETGWLARAGNDGDFTDKLATALREAGETRWRKACRASAEENYSPERTLQAWRFLGLPAQPSPASVSPVFPASGIVDLRLGGGDNPYHWLIYHLGALLELERAGRKAEKIVLEPFRRDFQSITLQALGYPRERWMLVSSGKKVPGSVAPPEIRDGPTADLGWLYDELRRRLGRLTSRGDRGARLLISRKDAPRARLENEEEILSALQPLGFRRICPGNMSWTDQVAAFAAAEVVVAVHGAALVHLLFSRPGTRLLEIFPSEDDTHGYDGMVRHGGIVRRKLMGSEERPSPWGRKSGLQIKAALVVAELREMGC